MQFLLYVSIPNPQAAAPHLAGHREFLAGEFADRHFLTFGPVMPAGTGGFVLAEYESRAELEAAIARDPLTVTKTASYDVKEIVIAKNQIEAK